jgi:hypothetical protein
MLDGKRCGRLGGHGRPGLVTAALLTAATGTIATRTGSAFAAPAGGAATPEPQIEVLFTAPAAVSPGPLVLPPSPLEVTLFAGQPRVADDGTWYALYRFPLLNPNDPFEFTRDVVMLRDGLPYVREGYVLAGSPQFTPIADLALSQQPFFDVSIAGDGAVAQILRGTDAFTLLPDGTPNAPEIDVEDVKFDMLVVDRGVVLTEGEQLDIVPGVTAPDNGVSRLSTVKAASAERMLVAAELSAGGTFDPETFAIFEMVESPAGVFSRTLRFTDDDANPIPGLGLNVSAFNGNEEDVDYNAAGSILIGVDVEGAPFDEDGAIVLYDGPSDTYSVVAREGQPSPIAGRVYDGLFNNPLALNDAGDIAFLGSIDGDFDTDGVLVRNGEVVIQEDDIVGTAVPGPLQLGFANANIEMTAAGDIIWYGAWNELKANVCPDNPDIDSSFVIFEGLFFNDRLLIEGGVTEVHNVEVGGVLFPTLVVKDLPNTGFAGFHVSPDGRWLIVHALLAEPSEDICAFSINNDATPEAQALLRIDLSQLTPSCPADVTGDGVVDVLDLNRVLAAFNQPASVDPPADVSGDGVVDVLDLNAVLGLFNEACP